MSLSDATSRRFSRRHHAPRATPKGGATQPKLTTLSSSREVPRDWKYDYRQFAPGRRKRRHEDGIQATLAWSKQAMTRHKSVVSAHSPRTFVPDDLLEFGKELASRPGVVGVFFGGGRKDFEWTREQTVAIHVRWKRPLRELSREERLHRKMGGYSIDVIEVGHPSTDALDHTDPLIAEPHVRRSTITAVARGPALTHGLLSGHGACLSEMGSS